MSKKTRIKDVLTEETEGLTLTEIKNSTCLDFDQINYTLKNHPNDFQEIFDAGMPKYKNKEN